ncbi:MAG: RNA polymerase sigma factor [Gammaproteobacteria bacterium]|nr:RNA polymerase sigma factor [Gammaproteobacteria bacterium]
MRGKGITGNPNPKAGIRRVSAKELAALHKEAFQWALHLTGYDAAEAEDLVQTAYLRVLDGSAIFRGESALKTWLFAIIRNVGRELDRSKERRRHLLRTWGNALSADMQGAGINDVELEISEQTKTVLNAIVKLPARQRELVGLVFFRDLSIAEAAQVIGVSIGSARTHYERAKKSLAQYLEGMQEK